MNLLRAFKMGQIPTAMPITEAAVRIANGFANLLIGLLGILYIANRAIGDPRVFCFVHGATLQFSVEGLMQHRLLQLIQRNEFALIDGFKALSLWFKRANFFNKGALILEICRNWNRKIDQGLDR